MSWLGHGELVFGYPVKWRDSSRCCRLDALSSERDPVSSLPVYAGTWPTYQSDFCLGGVAQLLRWCVAECGRGEGSRAVEATTVLWTEPFVPSGHSSSVKCSVSYHGTNSAPSSRPRDRHVLCSHIDALYLIFYLSIGLVFRKYTKMILWVSISIHWIKRYILSQLVCTVIADMTLWLYWPWKTSPK